MAENDPLLEKAIASDREALGRVVMRHAPEIRALLAARLDTRLRATVDIDDVMSVTCTEACLSIGSFVPTGDGSFAAWLTRMAENNLHDAQQ
ncbi:MAG TPA: sigma factor [Phycisphaerae bacterium]|jgi:DNA-directed RNA polymerase specialized sigma24 family protein